LVAPQIGEKLDFAPGFSLAKYIAPLSFDNKTLLELRLRSKYNVNLIGLRHSGSDQQKTTQQIINVPLPETIIQKGDLLWLVGSDEDLAKLPNK